MDRRQALDELPTTYAVALRMHWTGADDDQIASALDVPVTSVHRLLEIAASKLDAIVRAHDEATSEAER